MNSSPEKAKMLIVDNDRYTCGAIEEAIAALGIKTDMVCDPLKVLDQVNRAFYNLLLLDVVMSKTNGLDLIPKVVVVRPETKVIIMIASADKEAAIQALKLGAFGFLEKPVDVQLLSYTVVRALEVQKTEIEFKRTCQDLESSQEKLLAHKSRLESLNQQLLETNKALSVLAKNVEMTKNETIKEVIFKFRSLIVPIVEKLQEDSKLAREFYVELNMLGGYVSHLSSTLTTDIETCLSLSQTEFRVASLIKNGLTSEAIAKHLFISPSTVKTHRRNIRRKLGLNNQKDCLRDYLRHKLGPELGDKPRLRIYEGLKVASGA